MRQIQSRGKKGAASPSARVGAADSSMDATDAMASACDGADEVEGAAANSSVDAVDATDAMASGAPARGGGPLGSVGIRNLGV